MKDVLEQVALQFIEEQGLSVLRHSRGKGTVIEDERGAWLAAIGERVHVFALRTQDEPEPEYADFIGLLAHVCTGVAANAGIEAGNLLCDALANVGFAFHVVRLERGDEERGTISVRNVVKEA